MKNYKLTIQYVGEKFQGWQKQTSTDNTIQGKLESVLSLMAEEDVKVAGAGRTDAGVHAYGQIATAKLTNAKNPRDIKFYCNKYLPQEIAVVNVDEIYPRFHARLNKSVKVYQYRINNSGVRNVFENRFQCNIDEKLDISKMKHAAETLMGTHDFTSFSSNKNSKKSNERTIYSIDIEKIDGEISITFKGNGFLYNMVRIMVGTLIEIGLGERSMKDIGRIFAAKKRSEAGFLAEAKGLSLLEVIYEE